MTKILDFLLIVVLSPVLICAMFVGFYRELKWIKSDRYKSSKQLQLLVKEFDTRCGQIIESHGEGTLSIKAIAELAMHSRYADITNKKTFYLQVMTVCRRILPKERFLKNEFVILYFVKMSTGFITGKYKEAKSADVFTNVVTVEDLVLSLMYLEVLTEEVFKDRFKNMSVEDIQAFFDMHLSSFKCNYVEAGP